MMIEKRRFEDTESTVAFARGNGVVETLELGGVRVVRETLQPGWRWTRDMQPLVGTEVCEMEHVRYVLSGVFCIEMADGSLVELSVGDLAHIPPGHTGYVVGDAPCVMLDLAPVASSPAPA